MVNSTIKQVIKAVIYIRVSSEEQVKHGYSLQAQRERLLEYCKEHNYKVVDIYVDEGKSARSKLKSRTELQRLIKDAEKQKFDRIVFWRLDRWFRNISDYYKTQDILEENKIDWECSDEEYNTTTSNGRLHLNIKLSIAQNESDQTSDRIKFNFDNMIKNGRAIVGKQALPLGYKVGGTEKNKKIVKDENEAKIVVDMFKNIKITRSIRKTLFYINDKYNLTICYDSLRHYLKNKLYTGAYRENKTYCEPYITVTEFEEIQHIISHNVKRNSKYDYIFSGLLRCKECGNRLSGCPHTTIKTINGVRKTWKSYSYRCNKAVNEKRCDNKKHILENTVERKIFENLENAINKLIDCEEVSSKKETKQLDINKIKSKIDRLNELYIDGRINKEKYENDYLKYQDLIKNSQNKIKKHNYSHLKKLLNKDVIKTYNGLNNIEKRAFWGEFIDKIEISKEHFDIYFKAFDN